MDRAADGRFEGRFGARPIAKAIGGVRSNFTATRPSEPLSFHPLQATGLAECA